MKVRACILIAIWSILLIEPVSANFNIKTIYSLCGEKQSSCSKEEDEQSCCTQSVCDPSSDNEDDNDCGGNRCNPLMSCPTGNFYLFNQHHLSIAMLKLLKEKKALINDNRIVKQMAECWHPPEII